MAAGAGMDIKIRHTGGDVIAGVTTKSFAFNNEPIDITDDDDVGIRTTLANAAGDSLVAGNRTLDVSVSGVAKDRALIVAAINNAGTRLALDLEFVTGPLVGEKIRGTFDLTSLTINGERTSPQEFDCTLSSSGPWALI